MTNQSVFETIFNELLNLMQLLRGTVPAVEIDYRTEQEIYCCTIDRLLESGVLDILGRYYPGCRKVVVYDLLVRQYASGCGIPYRILYEIVLCHELAHAATHLGLDQNNADWSLFGMAPFTTVEYFAQIYTHLYYAGKQCREVTDAMEKLSLSQPHEYRTYLRSLKQDTDCINNALLDARQQIQYAQAKFLPVNGAAGVKPAVRFWYAGDCYYMEMELWGSAFENNAPVTKVILLAAATCTVEGVFSLNGGVYNLGDNTVPDELKFGEAYEVSGIRLTAVTFCETHNSSPLLNPGSHTLISREQDAEFVASLIGTDTLINYYRSYFPGNATLPLTWFI